MATRLYPDDQRYPEPIRGRLVVGISTSLVLHVLLLASLAGPASWNAGGGGRLPLLQASLIGPATPVAEPGLSSEAEQEEFLSPLPAEASGENLGEGGAVDSPGGLPSAVPANEAAALVYYPSDETDVRPVALKQVDIPVPEIELGNVERRVVLMLYIGTDGRVDDVVVSEANLPVEFQQVAISSFRQAVFSPARKNGAPVRSRLTVEIVFAADDERAQG